MNQEDPYSLSRFVTAQSPVYAEVVDELRRGHKRTHWMWFVFPQLKGLGYSPMAERYGISCLDEATAYLNHPLLGPRLRECTDLVNEIEGRSAEQIFGSTDALKFKSSMTLFSQAAPDEERFSKAVAKFYAGAEDNTTRRMLATCA